MFANELCHMGKHICFGHMAHFRKRALKDNRFDDANEAVIQQRFATYEAETKPILDYYAGDRIMPIDASQAPAKVLYDILGGIMTLDAWKELEKMTI